MMFREVIAVYCKNDTKQIIALGEGQILFNVKAGGTYNSPMLKRVELHGNYFVVINQVGLLFTVIRVLPFIY